jgi:transitional endoplasmic reticulum ATPase
MQEERPHHAKGDFSTAILDKKKAPNKLMVEDAVNDDNSTICLSQTKMNELDIFKGDPVIIKGKKRKETLCIALLDNELEDGKIRMNKTVRKNLRVRLGDIVSLKAAADAPNLTRIHVLPMDDTVEGISGDIT